MDYLICSAATEGSSYVDCLIKQRDIFEKKQMLYFGQVLKDRGSWSENTKIKPEAIRKAFKISDVVLWIDSDCLIDTPKEVFKGNWDIATTENIHPKHKCRISAGFILFRNTHSTKRFLDQWDRLNKRHKKDHPALMESLKLCSPWLKIGDMSEWIKNKHTINELKQERGKYEG